MLVWFIKPSFLARDDLIVGNSVDINELMRPAPAS
jgi:hypothetical protein